MRSINLELEDDQKLRFEFAFYQHNGAKIALNSFMEDNQRDYSGDHVKTIEETYMTTYVVMNGIIIDLLNQKLRGSEKRKIGNFTYYDGQLLVSYS